MPGYAIVKADATESNEVTIWRTSAFEVTALYIYINTFRNERYETLSEMKGMQEEESFMGVVDG